MPGFLMREARRRTVAILDQVSLWLMILIYYGSVEVRASDRVGIMSRRTPPYTHGLVRAYTHIRRHTLGQHHANSVHS